jgi:hypothetical protein
MPSNVTKGASLVRYFVSEIDGLFVLAQGVSVL